MTARGNRRTSWRHFSDALAADMADTQGGTTSEGIHLGAMAGTIDLLQRCYPGLQTRGALLAFDPVLPTGIAGLRLALTYRGHRLAVRISHDEITIASAPCQAEPITVMLAGNQMTLRPGTRVRQALPGAGTGRPAQRRPGRIPVAAVTDPVCGMLISESAAAASTTRQGVTYHFCSRTCRELFRANPSRYLPVSG